MGTIELRIVGIGVLFLFVFASGVWLSRSGRPLNSITLTIHKLVSLAAVVLIAATTYQTNKQVGLGASELGASVVTGLLFLFTIATGGLLSTEKPAKGAVLTIHRVTPVLTVLSSVVTLYLLAGRT